MSTIIITDHAIIRYLERVQGIDLDIVRAKILNKDLQNKIRVLGSGRIPTEDFIAYVKDNRIITVTGPGENIPDGFE